MNMLTKRSVVLYLMAVFVTGLVAGATGGFSLGKRKAFTPPRPPEMAAHICGRLKSKLHLTESQVNAIEPILNETAAELAVVHATTAERISEIIQKSNQRLAQFLTPAQKALLGEMERESRDFMRKACEPRAGAPGPWPPRNTN
jgi:hypothetical protein